MVFRNIYFQTVIRIVALFIVLLILAFIFGDQKFFFTQIILGVISIAQLLELINYYNKTNKELTRFLFSLKESDFTVSFAHQGNSKFENNLFLAFNEVAEMFKKLKTENEASYHFLKEIINGLDVGLIVLGPNERIELINKEAQSTLNIPDVRSWKHLKGKHIALIDKIDQINQYGSHLLDHTDENGQKLLSLTYNELIILDKSYRFILFKNIRSEIESKEIQAWHKLIRILTHEIMNSMTPLASLSDALKNMVEKDIDEEAKADLKEGLATISERSKSLLHFVDDYRKLTRVPEIKPSLVEIGGFIHKIPVLFKAAIEKSNTEVNINLPSNFSLFIDEGLIEQVLINLFKNSLQAVEQQDIRKIEIAGSTTNTHHIISISDSGYGIEADKLDKIFVPFFSTKEEGSGIGLSLSREIMNKHKGRIEVISSSEITTFSLNFKK